MVHRFFICAFLFTGNFFASSSFASSADALQIDSDQGTVCDRTTKTCTASGHVRAKRKGLTLQADHLKVRFHENRSGSEQISHVIAEGNVTLSGMPGEKVYAGHVTYNIDRSQIFLKGNHGTYFLPVKDVLFSGPVVKKEETLLSAHNVTVTLSSSGQGPQSQIQIKTIEGSGTVIFSNPSELIFAESARYEPASNDLLIQGNVHIIHPKGQIVGQKAEVNLDKKTSKMLSDTPGALGCRGRTQVLLLNHS